MIKTRSTTETSAIYAFVAIILTIAASTIAYFLLKRQSDKIKSEEKMRGESPELSLDRLRRVPASGPNVPTNLSRSIEENDPMQFEPKSNLHPPETNIKTGEYVARAPWLDSVVNDDIKLITKGDGAIRRVAVNGSEVPRELVEDAMFRNQDFMPRTDQFPLKEQRLLVDPTSGKQRSMFGKMTFPYNGLAMDVIRDSSDTRVTITNTAGRYEE